MIAPLPPMKASALAIALNWLVRSDDFLWRMTVEPSHWRWSSRRCRTTTASPKNATAGPAPAAFDEIVEKNVEAGDLRLATAGLPTPDPALVSRDISKVGGGRAKGQSHKAKHERQPPLGSGIRARKLKRVRRHRQNQPAGHARGQ